MKTFSYFNNKGEYITTEVLSVTTQLLIKYGLDYIEDDEKELNWYDVVKIMVIATGLDEDDIKAMSDYDKHRLLAEIIKKTEEETYVN